MTPHPSSTPVFILLICAVSVALLLLRPGKLPEVVWVGGGALALVAFRLIPVRMAVRAVADGTDVYLFLAGMMLLAALARDNGVFDWLASRSLQLARRSCRRLFLLTYAVGTVVTVCLSNDATAVVLTPAVLAVVRRSRTQPLPFLFACAMIANAASFVLPISNPANLVVFHTGMPSLGRWLTAFLVPSLFSIAVTFLVLRWRFQAELSGSFPDPQDQSALLDRSGKVVLAGVGLVVLTLLVVSSRNIDLGLPTVATALLVTGAVSVLRRSNPVPLLRDISWSTLGLVAALFVLLAAVQTVGALQRVAFLLRHAATLPPLVGVPLAASLVAVANNLINNLPLGLLAGAALTATHTRGLLANAILIAVDLGPNLSVTGSLATILWLLALRKGGVHITAWEFFKVGALTMPAALLASIAGLLATHALLRLF